MAKFCLYAGAADRAEPLLHTATEQVPRLAREDSSRRQMAEIAKLEHASWLSLGDCLLARGQWDEANQAYRKAYQSLAAAEEPNNPMIPKLFNTVVYTARRWRSY